MTVKEGNTDSKTSLEWNVLERQNILRSAIQARKQQIIKHLEALGMENALENWTALTLTELEMIWETVKDNEEDAIG